MVDEPGWVDGVYVAEATAPKGFRVVLLWDQSFLVRVQRVSDRVIVFDAGGTEKVQLDDFAALVAACASFVDETFPAGVVDWASEPVLERLLRQVAIADQFTTAS